MKEIIVISGKGGTGKTSLTASFASLAEKKVIADCDVDAADLHLVLQPSIQKRERFEAGSKAFIDTNKCTKCGICEQVCRFDAIKFSSLTGNYEIDSINCEGCGVCVKLCTESAITLKPNIAGEWFVSDTKYGMLVHAKLGIAESNSGKLVMLVKSKAREIAKDKSLDYILVDGPPGIGCPVISSISGGNLVVIVTEPTLSGMHDLERAIELAYHFKINVGVVINKYDINLKITSNIERFCEKRCIELLGKILYDSVVTKAMISGKPVVECDDGVVSMSIKNIWKKIIQNLQRRNV